MADLQNNVRFTWQLVSQFVSWEFCRYMSEQREDGTSETDVLTFLRNMIVQRTEKSMAEITKHEIVAKFIMETKEIQHISRMSCIIPLSESVKKIFPELEPAVSKLVHYLETFLNVLDNTDEARKELIYIRIEDAINDFIKEANRHLPQPHLLQVIESWSTQNGHSHPKPVKKVIYNAALFEKVLECLHYESITPSEAKLIAVSLYEDKVFEKILLNAEAEPETEPDSEQFSLSMQSSQPNVHIYSQEFVKNSQACNVDEISANLQPPNNECNIPDSLQLDNCSPVAPNDFLHMPDIPEFQSNQQPSHFVPATSPPSSSPSVYPLIHRDVSEHNGNTDLRNDETHNHMQFAQSSANESQSDDCNSTMDGTVTRKFKQIYENQKNHKTSDSDTSDCDKNAEIRFLTPTLFKKKNNKNPAPERKVVYLSDSDSSSIVTAVGNSQQKDPNWSMRESICKNTKKTNNKKKVPPKPSKKPVQLLYGDSNADGYPICDLAITKSRQASSSTAHSDSDIERSTKRRRMEKNKTKSKKKAPPKKPVQLLDSDSSDDYPICDLAIRKSCQPSTSAARSDSDNERPTKRRRVGKNVALYGSPNISIQDFVSQIKRPNLVTPSEVPVHAGTNTRSVRKKHVEESVKNSNKRQKCKQCSKAFKTVIALRRHVFLKHTEPIGDSDCDS